MYLVCDLEQEFSNLNVHVSPGNILEYWFRFISAKVYACEVTSVVSNSLQPDGL